MVSGCSTLVQFQAVHEIRALHYNKFVYCQNSNGNKIPYTYKSLVPSIKS